MMKDEKNKTPAVKEFSLQKLQDERVILRLNQVWQVVREIVSDTPQTGDAEKNIIGRANLNQANLAFLKSEKIDAFNTNRKISTASSNDLSKRYDALNHSVDYLRGARAELEERTALRSQLESAKTNLVLDALTSDPTFLLKKITEFKKNAEKEAKHLVRIAVATVGEAADVLPEGTAELFEALKQLEDYKDLVWDEFKNLVLIYKTDSIDAANYFFALLQIKVMGKKLIDETAIVSSTQYIARYQTECEAAQDNLINDVMKELEAISKNGILPDDPEKITELNRYLEIVSTHRDRLDRCSSEYLNTFKEDDERAEAFRIRCKNIHLIRPRESTQEPAKKIAYGLRHWGQESAAAKVEDTASKLSVDRAIRCDASINMATRTHQILKEHAPLPSATGEAEFLLKLRTNIDCAEEKLKQYDSDIVKKLFSTRSGGEESVFNAQKLLINKRIELCVDALVNETQRSLNIIRPENTDIQSYAEQYGEETNREKIKEKALNNIKLLLSMCELTTEKSTLNTKIYDSINAIKDEYNAIFSDQKLTELSDVDRYLVQVKSAADLSKAQLNEKTAREMLSRLMDLQGSVADREKMLAAVNKYDQSANSLEKTALQSKMDYVNRLYRTNFSEMVRPIEKDSDFKKWTQQWNINAFLGNVQTTETAFSPLVSKIAEAKVLQLAARATRGTEQKLIAEKPHLVVAWETATDVGQWNKVAKYVSYDNTIDDSSLDSTQQIYHIRDIFGQRLSEICQCHKTLSAFLAEKKHLKQDSPLDPRAAYLADLTPYALSQLITQLDDGDKAATAEDNIQVMSDIDRTRQEIAISMLERLELAKDGKPADLISKIDLDHIPSKAYALSEKQIEEYKTFITTFGDLKTKDSATKLPETSAFFAHEQQAQQEQYKALTQYISMKHSTEFNEIKAEFDAVARLRILMGSRDFPTQPEKTVADLETLNAQILQLKEKIDQLETKVTGFTGLNAARELDLAPFVGEKTTKEKMNSDIVVKKTSLLALTTQAHTIEQAIQQYCSEIRQKFNAVNLVGELKSTPDNTALNAENEEKDILASVLRAALTAENTARDSLNRYRQANIVSKFFMRFFGDGNETKRTEKLQSTQKIATEAKEKFDKKTVQYNKLVEAKSQHVQTVVNYVINTIRAELRKDYFDSKTQIDYKDLAAKIQQTKKFVETNGTPEQLALLEKKLDFSGYFIAHLAPNDPDLIVTGKLIAALQPRKANAIGRMLKLIDGKVIYNNDDNLINQLQTDLRFVCPDESDDELKTALEAIIVSTIIPTVNQLLEQTTIATDQDVKNLRKLLQAVFPNDRQEIILKHIAKIQELDKKSESKQSLHVLLSMLPAFSDMTSTQQLQGYSFLETRLQHFLVNRYDEKALADDHAFFALAEKLPKIFGERDDKKSVAQAYLDLVLKCEFNKEPVACLWQPQFAHLVEQYASEANKEKYRELGLKQLIENAKKDRTQAGSQSEEKAFLSWVHAFDPDAQWKTLEHPHKELVAWMKQTYGSRANIGALVSDPNPTRMHEMIVRYLGTPEQLQTMHKNWMVDFLTSLSKLEAKRDHYTETLLREVIRDKIVQDPNFKTAEEKIIAKATQEKDRTLTDEELLKIKDDLVGSTPLTEKQLRELVGNQRYAEVSGALSTLINNAGDVAINQKEEMVRTAGAYVTEQLYHGFNMPLDRITGQVRAVKSELDLDEFVKDYDFAELKSNPRDLIELNEQLLMSSEERRVNEIAGVVIEANEEISAEITNKDFDQESEIALDEVEPEPIIGVVDTVKAASKYDYHYHEKPELYYQRYIAPIRTKALAFLPERISKVLSSVTSSTSLTKINEAISALELFEKQNLLPIIYFGTRHVDPIIELCCENINKEKIENYLKEIKKDEITSKLGLALTRLGNGFVDIADVALCKKWLAENPGNPGVKAVSAYLEACEKANELREKMRDAHEDLLDKKLTLLYISEPEKMNVAKSGTHKLMISASELASSSSDQEFKKSVTKANTAAMIEFIKLGEAGSAALGILLSNQDVLSHIDQRKVRDAIVAVMSDSNRSSDDKKAIGVVASEFMYQQVILMINSSAMIAYEYDARKKELPKVKRIVFGGSAGAGGMYEVTSDDFQKATELTVSSFKNSVRLVENFGTEDQKENLKTELNDFSKSKAQKNEPNYLLEIRENVRQSNSVLAMSAETQGEKHEVTPKPEKTSLLRRILNL